jgi:signal transduction histidine kinase
VKLLNHTSKYFSIALLIIISVWAALFYINMLDEVYDSLDDGLDNYKILIIAKAREDSTLLGKTQFEESNYSIHEISEQAALTVKDVYKDTLMYMLNEEDYEPVRLLTTAFEHKGYYYELKVISSMVEEDDLIADLLYSIIWLYLAMLVSILIVNNLLLKRIWKPFYYLLDQLRKFKLGKDADIKTEFTRVDEFKLLNETVETLLKGTMETFDNQKQFIENASHELQTPLAISINKLELLAEKNNLSCDDMETVARVIQTLERLTRLNKSLLLLSKIENRQFQDIQQLHINTIVKNIVLEFEDLALFKNVHVSITEKGDLQTMMNQDLNEILISNLLKNAILHNRPKGTVEVVIRSSSLSITNTGAEQPLNKRIFDRLYKNTRENNTTGLGLAIVKTIADIYGISVIYTYHKGHSMTVNFKKHPE